VILAFTAVAALLTITPGVDMALVTRTALERDAGAARLTAAGICSGLLVWAALSAVGVAAVLSASAQVYTVLKLAGAAYLLFLGIQGLMRAAGPARVEPPLPRGTPYTQGLLTNLLNPKIAVFYATILPQFIRDGDPVLLMSLLLASIHAVLSLMWLSGYGTVVARAGDVLRRGRARRALDALSGIVLVGLGLRLALERR
jgi:threonine/homoserine/homoserine lactone efflux protein